MDEDMTSLFVYYFGNTFECPVSGNANKMYFLRWHRYFILDKVNDFFPQNLIIKTQVTNSIRKKISKKLHRSTSQ